MPAYVVAEIDITNPEGYKAYTQQVPATIEKYGGRFLVRGGAHRVVEGDWKPNRLVLLEFPSMDHAQRWYDSEEYREPKAMRLKAGTANLVMVEGLA